MRLTDEESVRALSELGTVLAKAQQWEWAEKVWMQAEEAIDSVQGGEGRMDEIFLELDEEVFVRNINNVMCLDQALKELSLELIQGQQWEQAEKVVHLIRESGARVEVMGKISIGLDEAWS